MKFSAVKQTSIDCIGQDVDTITHDTSDKEEQMYIEKNEHQQQ